MKGERMQKRSSFGNIMRRRLSDITNTQSQFKVVGLIEEHPRIPESTQDLLNQLLLVKQEKAMLQKLVEERKYPFIGLLILLFVWLLRNKIIELNGHKLRDLRMNYQNLQLQNWNLAQSNSQMLALKALQHELVCKDALHKARNLEPQGKADMNCQNAVSQEVEKIGEAECLPEASNDIKPCGRSGRRTARSRCTQLSIDLLQPWALPQQIEKLQKKRRSKPKGWVTSTKIGTEVDEAVKLKLDIRDGDDVELSDGLDVALANGDTVADCVTMNGSNVELDIEDNVLANGENVAACVPVRGEDVVLDIEDTMALDCMTLNGGHVELNNGDNVALTVNGGDVELKGGDNVALKLNCVTETAEESNAGNDAGNAQNDAQNAVVAQNGNEPIPAQPEEANRAARRTDATWRSDATSSSQAFQREQPKRISVVRKGSLLGLNPKSGNLRRSCLRLRMLGFQFQETSQGEKMVKLHHLSRRKETCGAGNEAQVSLRSSIGRPLRRAAEKVQSYKEVPLHVKMRRAEFTGVQQH
ncbi:hypothetical protein DKX38_006700 [Salix brachista]|uniref:Shugoshin C-terminal domain-containing protein n=1 Tax=Salix brachista TaxID=2182728 RepID=A0A5N5N501_9ROSI|nr:hypothetical protein DKX38_006700 [Salix brachista]